MSKLSLRVLLRVYCGDHYVGGMQGFTIPKHYFPLRPHVKQGNKRKHMGSNKGKGRFRSKRVLVSREEGGDGSTASPTSVSVILKFLASS